jgi:hypothetical protein
MLKALHFLEIISPIVIPVLVLIHLAARKILNRKEITVLSSAILAIIFLYLFSLFIYKALYMELKLESLFLGLFYGVGYIYFFFKYIYYSTMIDFTHPV